MRVKKLNPVVISLFVIACSISILSFMTIQRLSPSSHHLPVNLDCQVHDKITGIEDLLVSSKGVLFIASQDRHSQIYHSQWKPGKIYVGLLESDDQENLIFREVPGLPNDLQPIALSLYEGEESTSLFVLSYDHDGYLVAIFSWDGEALTLRDQHRGPELIAPNAIAASSHQSYYVLNTQGLYTPSGKLLESMFSLRMSHIVYHDSSGFKKLLHRFQSGYGLAYNRKTADLIVSDLEEKTISFLKPEADYPHRIMQLTSHPNRIYIEHEQDSLWIAAQPNIMEAKVHAANPLSTIASSEVLKTILPKQAQGPSLSAKTETEYLNDGLEISACTSVIKYKEHLFLGAPFTKKLLKCRLPEFDKIKIENSI